MTDKDAGKEMMKKHEMLNIAICRLDEAEALLCSLIADASGSDRSANEAVYETMSNLMDVLDRGSERLDDYRARITNLINELRTVLFG